MTAAIITRLRGMYAGKSERALSGMRPLFKMPLLFMKGLFAQGCRWAELFPLEASKTRDLYNVYFVFNFLIVLVLGVFYWNQNIPIKNVIILVVAVYGLILLPNLLVREAVSYGIAILFPMFALLNGYGSTIAIASWHAVLINIFILSTLRRSVRMFIAFCAIHYVNLMLLLFISFRNLRQLWLIIPLSSLAVCGILVLCLHVMIVNRRLYEDKTLLLNNLRKFMASTVHDYGRWLLLFNAGMHIMELQNMDIHAFLRKGAEGFSSLTARMKQILNENRVCFPETITVRELLERLKGIHGSFLGISATCPQDLSGVKLETDMLILNNALKNLVDNAQRAGASKMRLEMLKDGKGALELLVSDNGKGIPSKVGSRLFSSHIHSDGGGDGVGLLGVKFNLQFLGYAIELVESNTGGGGWTVFRISNISAAGS